MGERVIRVSVAAQVNNYLNGMDQVRRASEKAKASTEDALAAYERQNQAMNEMGVHLAAAGAVATVVTALAVKAAMSWESAWAGVTKTVEGTPAQLARVEAGLRDLTGELPAAHEEIAAVAEAAGQLGIQTDNVVAFTRTMIDLGETTNLAANDAATALARFMNIMGTSQDQVSNLGSAIVGLGNNYATTESEILDMAMRLAGAGKQIGLSEGEVLGLATALSSVGIEAEAGGSAVSKVMIDIAASVESGGDRLDQFAKVSGMSAKQFAAQWRSDPGKALAAFVAGLAEAEAQGTSTLGVLAEMGFTEVRTRDALLRSAAAADQFAGAMARGNVEFEANNALADEAAKRYATVESQLQIMRNRVNDAAIDFGAVFLPAVGAVAEAVGGLADLFSDMPVGVQNAVAVGIALAGAAALAGGAFLIAVPKIAAFNTALAVLRASELPAVASAAQGATTAIGKTTAGLSAAARFLTGPWGIALAAAAVGVDVLQKALQNLQATSEEMQNSLTTASSGASMLATAAESQYTLLDGFLGSTAEKLKDLDNVLERLEVFDTDLSSRGFFNLGKNADLMGLSDAIGRIGTELATLSATNFPAAQRGFRLVAAETDGSETSLRRLLQRMPDFESALVSQARELGINVTELSETERYQALLNIAMQEAKPVAQKAAEGYMKAANEAQALTDEVLALVDAVNEANGVGQDAVSTNARWQAALAGIAEQVERTGTSLDQNTVAGSENAAALADVAGAAQAAARAQLELDGQTMSGDAAAQKYYDTLVAQRQAFIDSAIAAGYNADEVYALADQVFKVPDSKEIKFIADTANARTQIENFIRTYDGKTITLELTTSQVVVDGRVYGGLRDGRARGGIIPGAPSNVDNRIYALATGEFVTRASQVAIPENRRALEYMNAGGTIHGYAYGGFVQPLYATGPGYAAAPAMAAPAPSITVHIGPVYGADAEEIGREVRSGINRELAIAGVFWRAGD